MFIWRYFSFFRGFTLILFRCCGCCLLPFSRAVSYWSCRLLLLLLFQRNANDEVFHFFLLLSSYTISNHTQCTLFSWFSTCSKRINKYNSKIKTRLSILNEQCTNTRTQLSTWILRDHRGLRIPTEPVAIAWFCCVVFFFLVRIFRRTIYEQLKIITLRSVGR